MWLYYVFLKNYDLENDFKITEELSGCNSVRRNAIRSDNGATHYLWLDTDLFFSQLNLQSMFQAISAIKDEYYIVSSELLDNVKKSDILTDVLGSDHAPVLLKIKID